MFADLPSSRCRRFPEDAGCSSPPSLAAGSPRARVGANEDGGPAGGLPSHPGDLPKLQRYEQGDEDHEQDEGGDPEQGERNVAHADVA